ncbi:hypothetical protein QBC43DRAFT_320713 [Cladorrhinum sp. PSN259]|nr:hypothetical protein QBC43DRAFT_320713 [Cladorrhinum sp. PSN259]
MGHEPADTFGLPLMPNGSRFLLVPDPQLPEVQRIAAELDFSPAGEDVMRSIYPCELSGRAIPSESISG